MKYLDHKISVAPMMDWTDRYCRYFLRLISKNVLLYTEMITTKAIIHGDRQKLLDYDSLEHPLALQLGGSDPKELQDCAKIGEDFGYDEINLNVGCPSDRVQAGAFGLCLMKSSELVADCVAAMKSVVNIPVTVKTRIGVDEQEDYASLHAFISRLVEAGVDLVTLHARKGWLKGLSPKENRSIPPLNYDVVYQLKKDFPKLPIGINGGIETLDAAQEHLKHVDSVMLGRAAYHQPYLLADVDQRFYGITEKPKTREEIVEGVLDFLSAHPQVSASSIFRHMVGLYHGLPHAKAWRQKVSARFISVEDF